MFAPRWTCCLLRLCRAAARSSRLDALTTITNVGQTPRVRQTMRHKTDCALTVVILCQATGPSTSRLYFRRLPIVKRDVYRAPIVGIIHNPRVRSAGSLRHADSDRERCLEFVHSGFDLVLFDDLPHISRPMLVQLMRVLDEKDVIGIDLIIAVFFSADGKRIPSPFLLEHCNHLPSGGTRFALYDDILDVEFLDGPKPACFMRKVHRRAVREVH